MMPGLDLVQTNVAMGIENIILLVVVLAGLVFYAEDFTIGLILHFFIVGLTFMGFYAMEWNFVPALVLTLMFFVLMSLSLYATQKQVAQGGFT